MPDREWSDLIFSVRRSRRYHMHFQDAYTRWNTLSSLLTALSGSATLAAALTEAYLLPWLAATTAIVGAIDLSLRTAAKAVMHRDLAQEFTDLEINIERSDCSQTGLLVELRSRRLEIEKREPPPHIWVDLLCHNEEVKAGAYGNEHLENIPLRQRLTVCLFGLRTDFLSS